MAGHKPWSGIKTKMTPEMRFNAMTEAESLAQEILAQKIDRGDHSLTEEVSYPVKIGTDAKMQAYVH